MLPDINNSNNLFITQDVEAFDDHAEDLMDDLFGDVENILSVDTSQIKTSPKTAIVRTNKATSRNITHPIHNEPVIEEQVANHNVVSLTKINLPAIQMPPISNQDIMWMEPHFPSAEVPVSNTRVLEERSLQAQSSGNLLDRFLFGTACVSVALAAVVWLINHGLLDGNMRRLASLPSPTPQVSPETSKFAEEVRTSLFAINTKPPAVATNSSTTGQLVPNTSGITVTPLANNGQLPPTVLNPLNGNVQPVYIPVYQPPSVSNVGNNNAIAVPSPLPSNSQNTVAVADSPYTLVGVLELGDRSSALLNINGAVQTVRVGMPIGDSGWILNRVGQQEIRVKRGSEVKSVFVGQKF